jgi:uncharacterized protein
MRLTGSRILPADPEAIWSFLLAPERLRRCLPGCERFSAVRPDGGPNRGPAGEAQAEAQADTFEATMRLGVGFLKGTYHGTIRMSEQRRPEYLFLIVEGGGALGSLTASGRLNLRDLGRGQVELTYDGEADVRGRVAIAGEHVLGATAHRLIGLFLDCVASHLYSPPS